jgi:hypothetical protein
MNIVTVNVGQGALAIVRHQKEAIIVDARIPPSNDRTVAYVKEIMALSLKDHFVKGLILTGFDDDHSDRRRVDRAAQIPTRLDHVPDLLQGQ